MTQHTAEADPVVFEGALTIRAAEAFRATLREAFERGSGFTIDCSRADEVDLSFVQLLVAARASAGRSGKTVALFGPPDGALLDTLTRGGFRTVREERDGNPETFWFEGAR